MVVVVFLALTIPGYVALRSLVILSPTWLQPLFERIEWSAFGLFVGWFVALYVAMRLTDHVVAVGQSFCWKCGYNLRGLAEPRCPECGIPFTPAEP